jgi:hypothetical protein
MLEHLHLSIKLIIKSHLSIVNLITEIQRLDKIK